MKITSVTDLKIKEFVKKAFDIIPAEICRNLEDDTIKIFTATEIIIMTPETVKLNYRTVDCSTELLYQQWLVAVHRHPLQEDNPFLPKVELQDPLERMRQYREEMYKGKTDEDIEQMGQELKSTLEAIRKKNFENKGE